MTTARYPLVVDLDGTLTPTDTLMEGVVRAIRRSPLNVLRMPIWLMKGRAGFKEVVARESSLDVSRLPYRESLVEWITQERQGGRRVILATAAHHTIATSVARHLDVFDQVLATTLERNLKGTTKLKAIQDEVGPRFVYAGDSTADVPIWQAAEAAVLVGVESSTAAQVHKMVPVEREFANTPGSSSDWFKALRVHQWLKNLLLFVPLLTAFSFTDTRNLVAVALAFLAFSLAASATYIVNDLWDLDSDRAHPRKRWRPFASGRLPIAKGMAAAALLLLSGFALAGAVSPSFLLILAAYVVLTSAYSWVLKEYVLVDVLMLAVLYTLRIVAGAVAIGVSVSSWLLAFSVFIFLSLALVKRCAELVAVGEAGRLATVGRDYRISDLVVLWPLGVGAALSAVVVFGLFISSPETQDRYASPQLLWFSALGLVYWLARLWVKTSRGEMHDDPVVYAIRDTGSRTTVAAIVTAILAARFVHLAWELQ